MLILDLKVSRYIIDLDLKKKKKKKKFRHFPLFFFLYFEAFFLYSVVAVFISEMLSRLIFYRRGTL